MEDEDRRLTSRFPVLFLYTAKIQLSSCLRDLAEVELF